MEGEATHGRDPCQHLEGAFPRAAARHVEGDGAEAAALGDGRAQSQHGGGHVDRGKRRVVDAWQQGGLDGPTEREPLTEPCCLQSPQRRVLQQRAERAAGLSERRLGVNGQLRRHLQQQFWRQVQ